MTSLLRADIRRLLQVKNGTHWFLIVLLAMILINAIVMPWLIKTFSDAVGESTGTLGYASPLEFAASLLWFGFLSLLCSLRMASLAWADMRSGFNRGIISSCGKKTYYLEKLLLALVVSFAFTVLGVALGSVIAAVSSGFDGVGSVPALALWIVLVTLACWACAAATLAILWLFKSNVLAYLIGISLGSGLISTIVSLAFMSVPELANAWSEVAAWFPAGAFSTLSGEYLINGEFALSAMGFAHVLLPTAVCLAFAYICAIAVLCKRDL
ncbi:MAG: hypothetical protein Q4A43_00220 [Coriobacteriia bacterium]|nr:hypothetical protein [Coriobacteriia bacterium]